MMLHICSDASMFAMQYDFFLTLRWINMAELSILDVAVLKECRELILSIIDNRC